MNFKFYYFIQFYWSLYHSKKSYLTLSLSVRDSCPPHRSSRTCLRRYLWKVRQFIAFLFYQRFWLRPVVVWLLVVAVMRCRCLSDSDILTTKTFCLTRFMIIIKLMISGNKLQNFQLIHWIIRASVGWCTRRKWLTFWHFESL